MLPYIALYSIHGSYGFLNEDSDWNTGKHWQLSIFRNLIGCKWLQHLILIIIHNPISGFLDETNLIYLWVVVK